MSSTVRSDEPRKVMREVSKGNVSIVHETNDKSGSLTMPRAHTHFPKLCSRFLAGECQDLVLRRSFQAIVALNHGQRGILWIKCMASTPFICLRDTIPQAQNYGWFLGVVVKISIKIDTIANKQSIALFTVVIETR